MKVNFATQMIADIRDGMIATALAASLPAPTDAEVFVQVEIAFNKIKNKTAVGNVTLRESKTFIGDHFWFVEDCFRISNVANTFDPGFLIEQVGIVLSTVAPTILLSNNYNITIPKGAAVLVPMVPIFGNFIDDLLVIDFIDDLGITIFTDDLPPSPFHLTDWQNPPQRLRQLNEYGFVKGRRAIGN